MAKYLPYLWSSGLVFCANHALQPIAIDKEAVEKLKDLVHLLHLSGLKLTKFLGNVPTTADRIDSSPQITEPKVIFLLQVDSSHVLGPTGTKKMTIRM